jgi:hypothetical protein
MIALDKCYQLSVELHSKFIESPREDAQIAATQLTQCGTNILTVRYRI